MDAPLSPLAATGFPGHFGELLQGRLGPEGPVVLVTLPMRGAVVTLGPDGPMPHEEWGQGLGLSTAHHRAMFRLAHPAGTRAAEIAHCLAAEGASDPMMFRAPARLLWASRLGRVMGRMPPPADFDLLCGLWGQGQRTDPADQDFPDIADLVRDWPGAAPDAARMAALASTSARRCLALRGPLGDPTEALANDLGALGFQIAHTGSARGLIFAPGRAPEAGLARLEAAGFRRLRLLRFRMGWLEG